jgi:GNAT superfamily N-acetyltransferase
LVRADTIAKRQLLRNVLGLPEEMLADAAGRWTSFALFDSDGACVANVDAAILPLSVDGQTIDVSGIRSVAVAEDWRGKGLFRALMRNALAWCTVRSALPTFLYTEEPALYARFGFRPQPQHAVVGPCPPPAPGPPGRRLELARSSDRALVRSLIERRALLSGQCALGVDADLFLANVTKDTSLICLHTANPETVIVYEIDEHRIVLVDIVGPSIPSLTTVLGAIGRIRPDIVVLFPTDKLAWAGGSEPDDTGLMILGEAPAAMRRPCMFPPTVEF